MLEGIRALGDEEQPVETAATGGLDAVPGQVGFLLVHADEVDHAGGVAEAQPSLVLDFEAVVAGKQKVAGGEGVEGWFLDVVVALADADGFVEQQRGGSNGGAGHALGAVGVGAGDGHAGLEQHKGAQRGEEAVGFVGGIGGHGILFEALAVQDGHGRIHVCEEEVDGGLDQVIGEEAGGWGEGCDRRGDVGAVHAVVNLGREAGLALGLTQFADDLCTRAFGAFLLRNGIVGAGELGRRAVSTGIDAIAFDLAAMASIAGSFDGGGHGEMRR